MMDELNSKVLARFSGRTFRLPFWLSIIAIVQFSFAALFLPVLVGAPPIIAMVAFFAAILVGIGLLAANSTYTLTNRGITVELTPFNFLKMGRAKKYGITPGMK